MKSLARNTYSLQVFPVCFKTYSSTCRISIITLISRIFLYNFEGQIFTISTIWGSIFPLLRFFSLWSCSICDLIWPKFYLPPKTGSLSFAFYCTSLPLYNGSGPFCEPFNSLTKNKCSPCLVQKQNYVEIRKAWQLAQGEQQSTQHWAENIKKDKRDFSLRVIFSWNRLTCEITASSLQNFLSRLCLLKGKTGILSCQLHTDIHVSLITNKHSLSGHESSYLYIISSNPSFCKDGRFWRRNKEKKPFIM